MCPLHRQPILLVENKNFRWSGIRVLGEKSPLPPLKRRQSFICSRISMTGIVSATLKFAKYCRYSYLSAYDF